MANTKRGYEFQIFYGVAGSTAATQLTNVVDFDENTDVSRGDTTVRGDGTTLPIETSLPVSIKASFSWKMFSKTGDTALAALIAAAKAGTLVALRTKESSSGTGFDGDVTLSVKRGAPLKGIQTYDFQAEASDDLRTPQLDV